MPSPRVDPHSPRVDGPWLIVAGGFHENGGMDRANAALASHLAKRGNPVHLVAHEVTAELASTPNVTVHLAPRPAGSFFLGEWPLEHLGISVARRLLARDPSTRVVVNGGNCRWADINWVHSLHHAWPCHDAGAPAWFKVKNRLTKARARYREQRALQAARVVIANSHKTRAAILDRIGVLPERVHTVYLGATLAHGPPSAFERASARLWLGAPETRPLAVFIGTLGYDNNKGFDTLWSAWQRLCARPDWDADLVVAGSGRRLPHWRNWVAEAGLAERVRFLGFSTRIPELLAAADVLVSPSRYEAYGLSVQEAMCRGVPAIASSAAGVAEHFTADVKELLLTNPDDVDELVSRLLGWRARMDYWRSCFAPLSQRLLSHSWTDMAEEIVSVAESTSRGTSSPFNGGSAQPNSRRTLRTLQIGMGWFDEEPGGLNRFFKELTAKLPAVGVDVEGLVVGSGSVIAESNGRIEAVALKPSTLSARWRGLKQKGGQFVARTDSDLVVSHFALYAYPLLKLLNGLPLVVHFQGPWALESEVQGDGWLKVQVKKRFEAAVYRKARRCIVLSQAFANILHEEYRVRKDVIRIIPGAVDVSRYAIPETRTEARQQLAWPASRPIVLAVRRLVPRMGLENLIDAALEIRRRRPDVLILVAGKGPLTTGLEARIRRQKLEGTVQLLGFLPDNLLPLAYRAADLTVVPTVQLEGFGLIVAESLAAGTPALVTPVSSLPEVVRGLSPALILESSEPKAIAAGVSAALDGTLPLPSPAECHRFAAEHYDWSIVTKRIRDVYEEALR
jgi:glycogen synthase